MDEVINRVRVARPGRACLQPQQHCDGWQTAGIHICNSMRAIASHARAMSDPFVQHLIDCVQERELRGGVALLAVQQASSTHRPGRLLAV